MTKSPWQPDILYFMKHEIVFQQIPVFLTLVIKEFIFFSYCNFALIMFVGAYNLLDLKRISKWITP